MTDQETPPRKQAGNQFQTSPSAPSGDLYVIPREDGWVVYRASNGGLQELARTSRQREAIERARSLATTQTAEIIIHDRNDQLVGREVFRDQDWELETIQAISEIDWDGYIDTAFYGHRPHIRGRRILVSMIAANARDNNWPVSRLAAEFSLSEEEIRAALRYAREHTLE
ncbi:MAG: DUF2188 domain-containing protein, partial [Anaerolineae bacterium]|nr:DUF2188 domain-containing protein [Anaerolineae bacterium]